MGADDLTPEQAYKSLSYAPRKPYTQYMFQQHVLDHQGHPFWFSHRKPHPILRTKRRIDYLFFLYFKSSSTAVFINLLSSVHSGICDSMADANK